MKVVFSNRAYTSVLAETAEKIKTETGGLFLGAVQDNVWYIIEAIDPGPNSVFEVAYFEYDRKYTEHLINKIANLYDYKLTLIGLWHRHPGSFDHFSSTDDMTNSKYAAMRSEGAISALVNIDPDFRLTIYHVNKPCGYEKVSYEVGDDLIPAELLRLKTQERLCSIMGSILRKTPRSAENISEYHRSVSLAAFMKYILPAMRETEYSDSLVGDESSTEKLIDNVIDDITFLADKLGIETSISTDNGFLIIYQKTVDITTRLRFMLSVNDGSVILSYDGKHYMYTHNLFREAFSKTKKNNETENEITGCAEPRKKGVIDSVIRMFMHRSNEE